MTKFMEESFEGKKVLVMGLGVFGGGVSTAKWLVAQGASVTVTDLKTKEALKESLQEFTKREKEKITFVLGRHHKKDFTHCDVVVVNPAVPRGNEYLKIAKKAGAKFENVASLFFNALENPAIGITGTRGKSTTTSFIAELLSKKFKNTPAIGSSTVPLLKELPLLQKNPIKPAVVELSSWQLELLPSAKKAPHIALITNLYRDHQNRYKNMEEYARAKANIFKYQNENDCLILNADNSWKKFFLEQKPQGKVFYFSKKPLLQKQEGVFISKGGNVRLRLFGEKKKLFRIEDFEKKHGSHNVENLLSAILSVKLFDRTMSITKKDVMNLGGVPMREEEVYKKNGLQIINDSASTSPDAVIWALERFKTALPKKTDFVLISGGTDKDLDFEKLAQKIKGSITTQNLLLIEGTGTKKLLNALARERYFPNSQRNEFYVYKTLQDVMVVAKTLLENKKRAVLLFSPGTASFEKFKNEVDRGEQFNALVKKYFK